MNTIHDLGGLDGFTLPERDGGRILKKEWERQLWGMRVAVRGTPGLVSGGRAAIESIPPTALHIRRLSDAPGFPIIPSR